MIDVVGVGAGGLPPRGTPERAVIDGAEVLLGGPRHLALVPADHPAERREWPSPLRAGLPTLLDSLGDRRIVVLASGDPLVSGIGATLIELRDADAVRVHPAVSSAALARARLGWSAETSDIVTIVGRDPARLRRDLHPRARLLVLLDGLDVGAAATIVAGEGYGPSRLVALGDLGSPEEAVREGTAEAWAAAAPAGLSRLTLLAVEARPSAGLTARATTPGLQDDAFENDGQLTKRHVRATALAHLAPAPGDLLWDLGAGAGSIGIEWARQHPRNRVVAVERHSERADRIARNAATLGVSSQLEVVREAIGDFLATATPEGIAHGDQSRADGAAPTDEAPTTGRPPDAIFIGGGARPETVDAARRALAPGGRLVVHGVTAETESLLVSAYKEHGGELVRLSVETAEPIGSYLGWAPARTVVQWSLTVPFGDDEAPAAQAADVPAHDVPTTDAPITVAPAHDAPTPHEPDQPSTEHRSEQ